MPEITIAAGETEELIPADQADREYIAEVKAGEVRMDHSARYAADGPTYGVGDRGELKALGGEAVYAYAVEDARVELKQANFLFDLFSPAPPQPRLVERPQDRAAREDFLGSGMHQYTIATGAVSETKTHYTNVSDETHYVQAIYGHMDTSDDAYWEELHVWDGTSETVIQVVIGPGQFPIQFDPAIPVPPGYTVETNAWNETGGDVTVRKCILRMDGDYA